MSAQLSHVDEKEFQKHVEALAKNILEKPKKMIDKNRMYWNEINSGKLNFERDELEVIRKMHISNMYLFNTSFLPKVECLRTLTKEDILSFYTQHIASNTTRKKLSLRMVSVCGNGSDNSCTGTEEINTMGEEAANIITDVTSFKSSLPLYPLLQSFEKPEEFKLLVPN